MNIQLRTLTATLAFLLLSACNIETSPSGDTRGAERSKRDPADIVDVRPAWEIKASDLLAADNCRGALQYLESHPASQPATHWYTLYSGAALLCWQDGLGDNYRERARAILDRGLEAFPQSPRLLKAKGDYYERTGDTHEAYSFYSEAAVAANKVLKLEREGSKVKEREEAEEVINELRLEGHLQEGR